MDVIHGSSCPHLLRRCFRRNCRLIVIEVVHGSPVQIVKSQRRGRIPQPHIGQRIKYTVCLCLFNGGGIQPRSVDGAGHSIIVALQGILAVVIVPGDGFDIDTVPVPVSGVGTEHDGIFRGVVCHQIRAAVGNVIGSLAIGIRRGGIIIRAAEFTALRGVILPAHGSKHIVAQHGHEVGNILRKGIDQRPVIQRLHPHLREIGDLTIAVGVGIDDQAFLRRMTGHQIFQAAAGIQHMLHPRHEIVRLHIRHPASLRIHPFHTGADLEGIADRAIGVFRFLIAFRQRR